MLVIALVLLTTSCNSLPSPKQDTEQTVRTPVTVTDANIVETTISQKSSQDSTTSGNQVKNNEGKVETNNYGNITIGMLMSILAAFAAFSFFLGVIIPQPAIVKRFWG